MSGHCPKLAVALALMTVGVGCRSTSVEPFLEAHEQALPKKWKNSSQQRPLSPLELQRYWQKFGDPVLNEIMADGLASSLDLETSLSRVREARAQLGVEQSSLFPRIGGNADGQSRTVENKATDLKVKSETWTASSSFSWEPDIWGKNWQRRKASKANLDRAREEYYDAQVLLSSQIAEAYINYRKAEAQLRVAEESIRISQETANVANWRKQAGTANALEALQVDTSLEQTRAQIPNHLRMIEEASNQLSILTARAPGSWKGLLGRTSNRMKTPSSVALGVPADTMRQRPDLRAAEQSILASVSTRRAAQLDMLPSFDLTGSIGVNAVKAAKLFSPEQAITNLAAGLTAPIFEGGRLVSTVRVQEEREKQSLLAYEKTLLQALSEVENAVYAVRRLQERIEVLHRAEKMAQESLTLAQQQFEVGRVNLLSVLEAQRTLINIKNDLVSARAELHVAHVNLYKALGGGWQP